MAFGDIGLTGVEAASRRNGPTAAFFRIRVGC